MRISVPGIPSDYRGEMEPGVLYRTNKGAVATMVPDMRRVPSDRRVVVIEDQSVYVSAWSPEDFADRFIIGRVSPAEPVTLENDYE